MIDQSASADVPDTTRRYSDEEVALILQRALEPRATGLAPAEPRDGLTLAQLEGIAAEAGIDLSRLREAAASLEVPVAAGRGSIVFGPPANYVFDREVQGEVPPENLSSVVAAARRLTRSRGSAREVGDWLEWQSDARIIHLTVKPENGKTSVQIMADGGFRALGIWGPTALATLITIVGIGAEAGISALGILGIAGGGFALARTVWEIVGRRARAKYSALAERLTYEISTLAGRGRSTGSRRTVPAALEPAAAEHAPGQSASGSAGEDQLG